MKSGGNGKSVELVKSHNVSITVRIRHAVCLYSKCIFFEFEQSRSLPNCIKLFSQDIMCILVKSSTKFVDDVRAFKDHEFG